MTAGRRLACTALVALIAPACARQEGPQVAFLLSTPQEERYAKDVRFFEARARDLGLRVVTLAADNDDATQIAQVEDVLAQGAKVLVIQPTDSEAAARYVQLAHEKGAKVVAYDRAIIDPALDYYVSHDSYRVGVLQAEAALRATHGKGTYVILSGQASHSVASEITRGYEDTLAPYIAHGDVTIALAQDHSAWSPEQALRTVETALARTGNHVDAILANNSGMARGAVQALAAAGLPHVFVAGADADAANMNLVCEGKQSLEIVKDIQPLAQTAAEVAKRLLDGERVDADRATSLGGGSVPTTSVRVEAITSDSAICKRRTHGV